ncbi:MAG TPA: lysophospholipid acyltransferase family protein [Polyangiales bacterium]
MAVPVSVHDTHSVEYAGTFDRVVRVTRGMAVAFAILFFWSGGFALAWVVVPYLALSERDPLERRRKMQRTVAASWAWFLRCCEAATIYRARYQGALPPDGPCVLVANHPSLLDVTAIIARMPHACCVVKSSLVNSPLVGRLLRACGHVAAGDGTLMSGVGVLDAVRERLQEGFPVLIFPEGTRSPRGGLHRFRRGAFEIAQRAGVPLVPLFLRCDPPALGKGTPVWRHPRRCPTLSVHVEPALNLKDESPVAACKRVELDFRGRLGLAQDVEGHAKE